MSNILALYWKVTRAVSMRSGQWSVGTRFTPVSLCLPTTCSQISYAKLKARRALIGGLGPVGSKYYILTSRAILRMHTPVISWKNGLMTCMVTTNPLIAPLTSPVQS